jgi:Flp pilus assembly protein TadD
MAVIVARVSSGARQRGATAIYNLRGFMRYLVGVALALFTASILALGQNESGTDGTNFQGRVRYENNTPAEFTRVDLWTDGEASWRAVVTTDRLGRFHTGTPCMVIQYKVDVPGYQPVWGRVDMSVNPCRALEDVTLRPTRNGGVPSSYVPHPSTVNARIAAIPTEARKEFDAGYQAIQKNDYPAAIPHMQNAISLYPKYAEAYQLLGVAQLQTNQGPQAEGSLIKAIEIDDRMTRAQYLLGVLYAKTGRTALAEKPLTRFAELDPQNPDAYFELAKVSFALNKFPEAETHARKSIELNEPNAGVHIVLGYSLLRQKKPDDAKRAFQRFLKLDSKSPMAGDVRKIIADIDQQVQSAGHVSRN